MTVARTAEQDAARHLARRPLSRAELRSRLLRVGHAAPEAERALDDAERRGWIDDAKLAYDWIVTRASRLGRGRARLIDELVARGVPKDVAETAWRKAVETGEADEGASVRTALGRRLRTGGAWDGRRYARMYTALLRDGFERDEVESALAPYRALLDRPDEGLAERTEE